MGGETLSSRRRENAALIQISKAPMKQIGNVYMRMTDLEYSRILMILVAKIVLSTKIAPTRSFGK